MSMVSVVSQSYIDWRTGKRLSLYHVRGGIRCHRPKGFAKLDAMALYRMTINYYLVAYEKKERQLESSTDASPKRVATGSDIEQTVAKLGTAPALAKGIEAGHGKRSALENDTAAPATQPAKELVPVGPVGGPWLCHCSSIGVNNSAELVTSGSVASVARDREHSL